MPEATSSSTTHRRPGIKTRPSQGWKKRRRKVKGWIFRSTVRCATYRPPVAGAPARKADGGGADEAKGLTYHDFHLAMSVDVEVAREEVRRLLCERTT